ncbi:MAG: LptF/LptG family permease [Limnochordaceae bacterium]|nr:LptF/LptG family permease [Limnochordaceae bacterium]
MRILWSYMVRQFIGPFFFGLAAFTSVFVAADLLTLVRTSVQAGVGLGVVAELVMLRLPQTVIYTFPMGMLLGTLLGVGQLVAGNELVAVRSLGVSSRRLFFPLLGLGLVGSAFALTMNEVVVPVANQRVQTVWFEQLEKHPRPAVQENVMLNQYAGGSLEWLLWAARYDPSQEVFSDVTIVTMDRGKPAQTIYTQTLAWVDSGWVMQNGTLYRYGSQGEVTRLDFQGGSQRINLNTRPEEVSERQKSTDELSARELWQRVRLFRSQGVQIPAQLLVRLHQKLALSLASLIFVMVGAALSARGAGSRRGAGAATGFGLSIAVIFVYYLLLSLGGPLAESGRLPIALGSWLPDWVLGGAGAWLLTRVD